VWSKLNSTTDACQHTGAEWQEPSGMVTFLAFVFAGIMPLIPYMLPTMSVDRFAMSVALTLLSLFTVGALRALIANIRWWRAGLEMFALGAIVAAVAYGSGALVATLVG
jgi:VIT1/CCC1 family predicted Fe2+/Mn2+ transporter